MKDQISADLAVMAGKVTPPAAVAVAAQAGAISPQSILVWLSIAYTAALLTTTVVKNWGTWMEWWAARIADLRRLWGWFRR